MSAAAPASPAPAAPAEAGAGPPRGQLPSTLRLGISRAGIELRQFFRDREAAIFTFIFPMLLLVLFGAIFNTDIAPGVTFSQYFVSGMIASGVVYTAFQNLAINIPQERDDGTLKRLQGSPMPKASYFIGKIGLVTVAYVAQVVILALIGVIFFKLQLPDTLAKWATFAWVSVLGLVLCTLLGIAFSSVPKSGKSAPAIVSPIVLVLQFISGVFIVFSQLPSWMQDVASIFPLKWLVQGMQSVFLPESFAGNDLPGGGWDLDRVALVLVGWTIAAAVLALVTFRWQRRGDG